MRRFLRTLLICLLTTAALAQENPPKAAVPTPDNALSAWNKFAYGRVKDRLLRSGGFSFLTSRSPL
jgi:hypothetical protein